MPLTTEELDRVIMDLKESSRRLEKDSGELREINIPTASPSSGDAESTSPTVMPALEDVTSVNISPEGSDVDFVEYLSSSSIIEHENVELLEWDDKSDCTLDPSSIHVVGSPSTTRDELPRPASSSPLEKADGATTDVDAGAIKQNLRGELYKSIGLPNLTISLLKGSIGDEFESMPESEPNSS